MDTDKHLTRETFDRLLAKQLTVAESLEVYLHLVSCDRCGAAFLEYDEKAACRYLAESPASLTAPVDLPKSLALEKSLTRWPDRAWPLLTANLQAYRDPSFVLWLLETARSQWPGDPTDARYRVLAALQVLKWSQWEPEAFAMLSARAYAYYGNVERIFHRYDLAAQALRQAVAWGKVGQLGRGFEAELAVFRGKFYADIARLHDGWGIDKALTSLERAVKSPTHIGGEDARLEATVTLGITYGEAGQLEKAIGVLRRVLEHPRVSCRPALHLASLQSLAIRYAHLRRPEVARVLLPRIRNLALELDEPLTLIRCTWLEAEISAAERNRCVAAKLYREVQGEFLAYGIPGDAALAGRALAELENA